ncbi:hypothetical protein [Microviridae sp.]|nr:hypothetical protein [Microviridae sp.]UOF78486.1 hypothetical protein [Microviridae sp.]
MTVRCVKWVLQRSLCVSMTSELQAPKVALQQLLARLERQRERQAAQLVGTDSHIAAVKKALESAK